MDGKPILRALAMMHQPEVVAGLIAGLSVATKPELRREILSALCCLHFQEGPWKGDSWGTRPDTRGPYYQPEPWSETNKIAAVLQQSLNDATPDDAAHLIELMQLNRIQSNDALDRMLRPEFTVMKEDIEERKTSPTSIMPTGVMNDYTTYELASLLDYLESLAP